MKLSNRSDFFDVSRNHTHPNDFRHCSVVA
jgi:hypothetical protein